MSYSVKGNVLSEKGKEIEQFGSHGEAVAAAQDRTKSSGVSVDATAMAEVALNFDSAVEAVMRDTDETVRVLIASTSGTHKGQSYEAGSRVVVDSDDKVTVLSPEKFDELYELV